MNPSPDIIRELELKRKALNERLMNAKDIAEANAIERELWALRAAIRYHKSKIAREARAGRSSPVRKEKEDSYGSSGTSVSG
jgi:hypothetical protein